MPELSVHYLLQQLSPQADQQFVLALSGGLDSMVLLHLLYLARQQHSFSLQAVYVDHGISVNAAGWGEFCAAECAKRQIPFMQRQVKIDGQDNLEFRARSARYAALAEFISTPQHLLLTAHHADDQFETLLLALKRGSGVAGLAGMRTSRAFAAGQLCRPLLAVSRAQLQQYAQAADLRWVEDDSNTDLRFERNFIRSAITPVLNSRWPQFIQTAGRTMDNMAQLQQLLDEYSIDDLKRCTSQSRLNLTQLQALSHVRQNYVIRRWLQQWQLNPSSQWLTTLQQDVIAAREDACPVLQLEQYQLRRFGKELYLLTNDECEPSQQQLTWNGETNLMLAHSCGQLSFSSKLAEGALPLPKGHTEIVFGRLSLRFKPAYAAHSKPLKQWFKLWQVPPWQRSRIPLLLVDGQLSVVAGYHSSIDDMAASHWISWQP